MQPVLTVERLSARDNPQNVALSNAVGWPDTESEWRVVHDVARVLGVRRAGELVGQGALGLFDGAGTIAKMVVSPGARRQGIGGSILDALLAEANARSLVTLGLVATPPGQPLYASRGFEPLGEVVICMGTPRLDDAAEQVSEVSDAQAMLSFDQRFITCSRAAVLCGRLRESCASAMNAHGFALATSHASGARLGPIIAASDEAARSLTMALFRAIGGPVRVDVPAARREFRRWLQSLDLVEKGAHLEMSRGGALPWDVAQRFGLATQAWC